MQYGFIIDNRKCIGCHACTVACKAEHEVPLGVNRTWVKYIEKGTYPNTARHFSVMRCNHCEDAPCVEICPVTALYTRKDGIVDFDPRRCIGCKGCMQACPYDALYIDPDTHTAAKCNYCAHRVDIGLEPACVNVCPEHAIISGDMDDGSTEISQLLAKEQVTVRKIEKDTKPRLYYIDGDEASLTPGETATSDNYMWSSQSDGVGHFARYIEERTAKADPEDMIRQLGGAGQDGQDGANGQEDQNERTGNGTGKDAAARRVYDAPDKGVLWGNDVAAYVWTKAISAGAFLLPFAASVFGHAVDPVLVWAGCTVALTFLLATTILLVSDLTQPKRFLYVLFRPQWRSWLVLGGYALTLYGLALTLWAAAMWTGRTGAAEIIGWVTAALAVITAVYTAFLFAQAKGRDFWQSPTLVLHMLLHAVLAGAAVFALALLFGAPGEAWSAFVRNTLIVAVILNLLVIASEMLTPHPTADARKAVQAIVRGRYRVYFWILGIAIGNLAPFVLAWIGGEAMLAAAGAGVLIGLYATEYVWVRAPQDIPLS
ncbi:MAG: 4Fe-4S ferredoxin [Gemmatimonadetes bacterium]|nr:4Fe-4S ferredoxin [Gemmatimonadota bacterium]MYG16724.1 4Fe-4S ferredoxin [Gemmatimonadota bacterium]